MTDTDAVVVTHDPDRRRYDISVGSAPAGHEEYVDLGDQRIFYHTEIDEAFGGRGLGGALVTFAVNDARDSGKRIVPVCPYVKKWLEKHDDVADAVDPVTPAALTAVQNATS